MSDSKYTIDIIIKAANDQAKKAFDEIKQSSNGFVEGIKSANTAIMSAISSYGAISAAVGGVIVGVRNLSDAYAQQEKAEINLEGAMRKRGTYTAEMLAQYKAFSEEMQATALIEDEEILKMLALGETYGLTGERLKETARLSADMAVAFADAGVTADAAMKMIGKAAQGDVTLLKRVLGDMVREGMSFDEVMQKLNDTVGGRSVEAAKGAEAQWKKLDIAWGELKEKVGKEVTPAIVYLVERTTDAINTVGELIRETERYIDKTPALREAVNTWHDLSIPELMFTGLYDLIGLLGATETATEEEEKAFTKAMREGVKAQKAIGDATKNTTQDQIKLTEEIEKTALAASKTASLIEKQYDALHKKVMKSVEEVDADIQKTLDRYLSVDWGNLYEGAYSTMDKKGNIFVNPGEKPLEEAYPGQYSPGEAEVIYAGGSDDDIASRSWSFGGGLPEVGSFDKGTDYVPRTGKALVHQGEMIIPAKEAAQVREARNDNRNYSRNVNITINNNGTPIDNSNALLRAVQKAGYAH